MRQARAAAWDQIGVLVLVPEDAAPSGGGVDKTTYARFTMPELSARAGRWRFRCATDGPLADLAVIARGQPGA